jgi:hypothetical protein
MDFFMHWEAMKGLSHGDPNGMIFSKVIRNLKDNFKLLTGSPE